MQVGKMTIFPGYLLLRLINILLITELQIIFCKRKSFFGISKFHKQNVDKLLVNNVSF